MKNAILLLIVLFLSTSITLAQTQALSKDSEREVGQSVTVIEKVSSIKVEDGITVLSLGEDKANQFQVLLKAIDQTKGTFKAAEMKGRQLLVTGKVIDYRGKPTIVVTDPKQVQELTYNDSRPQLKGTETIRLEAD